MRVALTGQGNTVGPFGLHFLSISLYFHTFFSSINCYKLVLREIVCVWTELSSHSAATCLSEFPHPWRLNHGDAG